VGGKSDAPKIAERLFRKGVRVLQLRSKNAPSCEFLSVALKIRDLAKKYKRDFIINDRPDVAIACGASGIHAGNGDMPTRVLRKVLGTKNILIGRTVHSVKDVKEIKKAPVDYLGAGPVFYSPLKKTLGKKGPEFIKRIKKITDTPVFAIGGITMRNVKRVFLSGADGACVSRHAGDSGRLLKKIRGLKEEK